MTTVVSNTLSLEDIIKQIGFPVALKDIYFEEDHDIDYDSDDDGPVPYKQVIGHKTIIRTDTQEALSVVTNRYNLVSHTELLTPVLEALQLEGYQFDKVALHGSGKRVVIRSYAPKAAVNVWGMDLYPRMLVTNSYDRTLAVRCQVGLMNENKSFSLPTTVDGSHNSLYSIHSSKAQARVDDWRERIQDNSWIELYVDRLQSSENRIISSTLVAKALEIVFSKHQIELLFPTLQPMTYRKLIETCTMALTSAENNAKDNAAARRMIETAKKIGKLQQHLNNALGI